MEPRRTGLPRGVGKKAPGAWDPQGLGAGSRRGTRGWAELRRECGERQRGDRGDPAPGRREGCAGVRFLVRGGRGVKAGGPPVQR